MNASALLQRQGWRGKGHTLHASDNSIGLTNPLLLSRNTDGSGIGANKQMTDQWWLAAFDEKLKGLDTSKKGVVVQSVTKGKLDAISSKGGKYSGLYLSFVRGGLMEGTLDGESQRESTDTTPEQEEAVPRKKESKVERRARKAAKLERRLARQRERARKEELKRIKEAKKENGGAEGETKEERKARRAEARARKEARRKRREEKAAKKAS